MAIFNSYFDITRGYISCFRFQDLFGNPSVQLTGSARMESHFPREDFPRKTLWVPGAQWAWILVLSRESGNGEMGWLFIPIVDHSFPYSLCLAAVSLYNDVSRVIINFNPSFNQVDMLWVCLNVPCKFPSSVPPPLPQRTCARAKPHFASGARNRWPESGEGAKHQTWLSHCLHPSDSQNCIGIWSSG